MSTPGATWSITVVDETGSTNADLLAAAAAGAADGSVLMARHQTAGKGRLDRRWDAPAGAALAAAVFGGDHAAWTTVAALLGGTLAATSHVAKATTRAAANTSPEPFSNIGLSLAGDVAVPTMLWLAWAHPFVFFPLLAVALAVMTVLTWFCFKFVRALVRRVRRPASA
jgi:hypothetical protein